MSETIGQKNHYLRFDFSDEIYAEYVIQHTKDKIEEGSLIAIDYLQLLDQQRSKSELHIQVESLKAYAKERECIIIFISQIDRSFEEEEKGRPSLDDVRQPNPVDLGLFNKSLFLHNGKKIFTKPVNFEID